MGNKNVRGVPSPSSQNASPRSSYTPSAERRSAYHTNSQHTDSPPPYNEVFPSAPCEDDVFGFQNQGTRNLYPNLQREPLITGPNSRENVHREIPNPNLPGLYPNHFSGSNVLQKNHDHSLNATDKLKEKLPNNGEEKTEKASKALESVDDKWMFILSRKEPAHVVSVIKDQTTQFITAIKMCSDPETVPFILRILEKLNSEGFKELFLNDICCENFFSQLDCSLSNLSTSRTSKDDMKSLLIDVVSFYKMFLPTLRGTFNEKFSELLEKTTLAIHHVEVDCSIQVPEEIKQSLKNMEAHNPLHGHRDTKIRPTGKKQQCYKVQPVVANLLRNIFENVHHYETSVFANVRGVTRNVYFIDCNDQKNEVNISNEHFVIHIAKYLLKQHYQAKDISILVTSGSKMPIISKLKEANSSTKDIQVRTTDNLDTEGSCITLVYFAFDPSRGEKMNLNLHVFNVLSRAKEGLYMIGNTALLHACNEWRIVKSALMKENVVGPHLMLCCDRHHGSTVRAVPGNDFPKHVCSEICNALLPCGHTCKKVCHVNDPDHSLYQCRAPCSRKLEKCSRNHFCSKRCFEYCGPCVVKVYANNNEWKNCYEFKDRNEKCSVSLKCGHHCGLPLANHDSVNDHNEHCTKCPGFKECNEKHVSGKSGEVILPCQHKKYVTAKKVALVPKLDSMSKELVDICDEPCSAPLVCGHECSGTCGKCRQGNVHVVCLKDRMRHLACGHRVTTACSSTIRTCRFKCFYQCPHGKCRKVCGQPCTPCKRKCELGCEHSRCSKLCFELCDIKPCDKPCSKMLPCGHECIGLCGEPCPPKCRVCDSKLVTRWDPHGKERFVVLADCNHIVRVKGLDSKLKERGYSIQTLICPVCDWNIFKTWRYINYNKMLFRDLAVINLKNEELKGSMKLTYENTLQELLSIPLHFHFDRKQIMQDLSLSFPGSCSDEVEPIMVFKALFLKCLVGPLAYAPGSFNVRSHCKYLILLLKQRSEDCFSAQVLKELYKELVRYYEDNTGTDKEAVINVHRCIAFACMKERYMWSKCIKGHIHSSDAIIIKCYACNVLE